MKPVVTAILAIAFAAICFQRCGAEEQLEEGSPDVSRQEWKAQVKASRERAVLMRREHPRFIPQLPTVEELAEEASRRVISDDSLKRGDIVSTSRGLFRFDGDPERERKPEDFVKIR